MFGLGDMGKKESWNNEGIKNITKDIKKLRGALDDKVLVKLEKIEDELNGIAKTQAEQFNQSNQIYNAINKDKVGAAESTVPRAESVESEKE